MTYIAYLAIQGVRIVFGRTGNTQVNRDTSAEPEPDERCAVRLLKSEELSALESGIKCPMYFPFNSLLSFI